VNNIIIPAVINDIDTLDLMFHLAEGSISLISDMIDSLNSLKLNEESNTVKSWGGDATARYATNNTIKIGKLTKDSITIHETGLSGPITDGKFGPNYFGDKPVEINFDMQAVVVHDSLPSTLTSYTKYDLEEDNGMMFISGLLTINNEMIENKFLLHTGYGGRLLLDDEFANQYDLDKKLQTISVGELKDSYGNIIKTKTSILSAIRFRDHQFTQLPISFFAGSIGRQKMSVMGCDLIRRFNIIIDRKDKKLYLNPNTNFNLPFLQI